MSRLSVWFITGAVLALAACGGERDEALAQADAGDEAASAPENGEAVSASNPLAPGWLQLTGAPAPEEGRYACQDWDGYSLAKSQANASYGADIRQSSTFTSQFSITGKSSYTYHGHTSLDGSFSYSPVTGDIIWESGPYSSEPGEDSTITGIYGRRASDGVATVVQIFRDPSYGEAAELCFKYEEAGE